MKLKIIRDKNYDTVSATDIHGKYPYKLYLEILGNSTIGRYIVVVSDRILNEDEEVTEIIIQLIDKVRNIDRMSKIIKQTNRPNMVGNAYFTKYQVRECSILDVMNRKIQVYNPIKE